MSSQIEVGSTHTNNAVEMLRISDNRGDTRKPPGTYQTCVCKLNQHILHIIQHDLRYTLENPPFEKFGDYKELGAGNSF